MMGVNLLSRNRLLKNNKEKERQRRECMLGQINSMFTISFNKKEQEAEYH